MGAGHLSDVPASPVSVGVVFERFPASVRGAVVVRGTDPDPHQVRLVAADVVEAHVPARAVARIAVDPVTVDVAPRAEVLIPFDVPLAGLPPGWYSVVAEVVVDGQSRVRGPQGGKRFVVPWPAHDVRQGRIDVGVRIPVPGTSEPLVERLECHADRAVIRWRHDPGPADAPPALGELRVSAGSRRLPVLEASYEAATGARTTVIHPVLKRHRKLSFELDRRTGAGAAAERGRWSASFDLP
ncbi:MAG TPA: hypothetical protein VHL78_04370 [Actinomycetota bacterium]|nr:hypothetical protein [Actinomycetota bacterium]